MLALRAYVSQRRFHPAISSFASSASCRARTRLPRAPPHHPICSVCVCARVFPSCTSVNRGPPTAAAILFSCHGCLAQLAVRTGGLSGWQHAHGQSCLWWWGLFSSLWRCSEQSALVQRLTALQTMQANRPRRTNPREWVLRPLETNRSSKPAKDVSKT